jgi:hypothetical protein
MHGEDFSLFPQVQLLCIGFRIGVRLECLDDFSEQLGGGKVFGVSQTPVVITADSEPNLKLMGYS